MEIEKMKEIREKLVIKMVMETNEGGNLKNVDKYIKMINLLDEEIKQKELKELNKKKS